MSRRFQFSLRALFVAFTIACAWLGYLVQSAREQNEAVRQINALGGSVGHDGYAPRSKAKADRRADEENE